MIADHVGHLAHLNTRDTTLGFASRASQTEIAGLKRRMGWSMPWYTMTDGFDVDYGVDEWHGTNVFLRDGDRVFRTYFVNSRGDEVLGNTWSFLDLTPLGRQEAWEDSPEGYPQEPPYAWWNGHDSYADAAPVPDRSGCGGSPAASPRSRARSLRAGDTAPIATVWRRGPLVSALLAASGRGDRGRSTDGPHPPEVPCRQRCWSGISRSPRRR